jgi:hypothetical protein
MRNKIFLAIVFASFIWNLFLVIGVVFGANYALDRAAGGQFEVFPMYIRVIYLINVALIVYQVIVFIRLLINLVIKPTWIVKAFMYLGVIGVVLNAISRSPLERWNVVPAAIITFAFYRLKMSQELLGKKISGRSR